ncbi:MAG: ATP synthase F1 subunit delta [Bacteroidales bacterium]|nr:ATP synthase F1 subunit delta [Bacteroidales bacterium]MCF8390977.1 ATP synthase F1 subunit delta [Bacteroidales bacterium]
MNESKISVRYAKALFLSSLEEKSLDVVFKDVGLLNEAFIVPGFVEMLMSPVIKTSEKKKLMETVYEKNISPLSMKFLNLVVSNNRETYLEGILRNFVGLYRKHKGIKKAELIVSSEVSDDYKEKFLNLLGKVFDAKIELNSKINPDIIGGFILKVDDEQFDASVSSALSGIKKNLLEKSY